MNTPASPKAPLPLPPDGPREARSRRARTEPMSVLALGDGLYEVESASDSTYLVDVEAGRCTCPDHVFRGVRCKHVRRVAIEITEGLVPPPGEIAQECVDCAETVFIDEEYQGPVYCVAHTLEAGDTAVDRETGSQVTVVGVSVLRADYVRIREADCTVASHPTNDAYEPEEPVVAAIYPHARVEPNGPVPRSLKVYLFPRTRLRKVT
ncbi:SWIM zinc finger family protein [Natrialbaceae archaeon A-gly3]